MSPIPGEWEGRRVTLVGAGINAGLIGFKFWAGIMGRSQALIADAVHSVSDLFTDAVVLLGLRMGRRGPDETHLYGHGKFETISSALVGAALAAVALYLGIGAAVDVHRHTERHPTLLALVGAGVSILVKETLCRYTMRVARRIRSNVLAANAWHHRSDALSSVAVLFGVGAACIRPSWHILDAYAAMAVSLLILKVGIDILWAAFKELTDSAPDPQVVAKIRQCAQGVEGVGEVHDLRVRSSGGLYEVGLHVVVDSHLTVAQGHRIAKEVEACLKEQVESLGQVMVHVDPGEFEDEEGAPVKGPNEGPQDAGGGSEVARR